MASATNDARLVRALISPTRSSNVPPLSGLRRAPRPTPGGTMKLPHRCHVQQDRALACSTGTPIAPAPRRIVTLAAVVCGRHRQQTLHKPGFLVRSIRTACCHRLGALSVRWMQPAQQQGRLFPSSSSSRVRSMRRRRVAGCFASSTQQMNSMRPSGVSSCQRRKASASACTAASRSVPASWTVPCRKAIVTVPFRRRPHRLGGSRSR